MHTHIIAPGGHT